MIIKYFGHSAFLFLAEDQTKIITDPYSPTQGVNYKPIAESADIVTISHEHWDHNGIKEIRGEPLIIRGEGSWNEKGISIRGIPCFHDENRGKERGANTIFVFDLNGLRLCHLGDIGHRLTDEQLSIIGKVNICFIPVGGYYTVDRETAMGIIKSIAPHVTIPMHFKTQSLEFPIADVEEFLKGAENVKRIEGAEYKIDKDSLPSLGNIVVLNPVRAL